MKRRESIGLKKLSLGRSLCIPMKRYMVRRVLVLSMRKKVDQNLPLADLRPNKFKKAKVILCT